MAVMQGPQDKKNLNFELNLLPVFDVLSVCICFLLMTVVWVEVRALETKQAFGGQSLAETSKEASLWLTIDENNNVVVLQKSANGSERKSKVSTKNGEIDFDSMKKVFSASVKRDAKSTHIIPSKTTKYEQVVKLMDMSKQVGINNIGLSPI